MMRAFGVCQDYQRYVLLRRIFSNRQVLEVMTEFWENHLNVPLNGEPYYLFRRAYGETLRAHAFGRYEDLLFAAVTHPAMLIYLDNSTPRSCTPTRTSAASSSSCTPSAPATTTRTTSRTPLGSSPAGGSTPSRPTGTRRGSRPTSPSDHWVGPVRVMDFADANASATGETSPAG